MVKISLFLSPPRRDDNFYSVDFSVNGLTTLFSGRPNTKMSIPGHLVLLFAQCFNLSRDK